MKWKDLCDFSNYSKDSNFFDSTNKKVIGKMKDEFGGIIVDEFVGLKSKMCLIIKIDGKESNTAKGVNIETFSLIKDLLDKKWKEFNLKNIKYKPMKLTKHHYHVLMIKDTC